MQHCRLEAPEFPMSVARETMQLRLFVVQRQLAEFCECWSELRGVQVGMRMRGGALPGDSIIPEDPQDIKNGATSPSMAPQLPAMQYGSMQFWLFQACTNCQP
jgi:hypothetical protein